jgi:hypothetical protein
VRKNKIEYIKYPRTFHLPWSLGKTNDDKVLNNVDHFIGKRVIVTEKLDGENSTLYSSHLYARSIDSKDHPSRHWLKQLHSSIKFDIPDGWRICGENLYAKHSIGYDSLLSYFLVFSIWNEKNICLSWDETVEWAKLLGLDLVPVLYDGIWDENKVKQCFTGKSKFGLEQEGYVVRLADKFYYSDFSKSVSKFVRENHVQTDKHWMQGKIEINKLV